LIDGGDNSHDLVTFLRKYVDGPLEVMVATHPHADHIGGLTDVLSAFTVLSVWTNGETSTSTTYRKFVSAVNAEGTVQHIARQGGTITTGKLSFYILNPIAVTNTTNNNSIVLSLKYGTVDFLFMGDTEKETEARLFSSSNSRVLDAIKDVEILKVGHHGSRTASSSMFLSIASPETAIYSAGVGNTYGHPHQETITTLTQIGAEMYGTDKNGTVGVGTNGITYVVATSVPVHVTQSTTTATTTTTVSPTTTMTLSPTTGLTLKIVSVTSPVGPGYNAMLLAKTAPGATCGITVYYKSGSSTAQGLYPKTADVNGNVSWTWKVGTRTTPGSWRIVITANLGGNTVSQTTYFTVQ
jgi:competence protein ComEC